MKSFRIESCPSGLFYLSFSFSGFDYQSYDEFLMDCNWFEGLNKSYCLWCQYDYGLELDYGSVLILFPIRRRSIFLLFSPARVFNEVLYVDMYQMVIILSLHIRMMCLLRSCFRLTSYSLLRYPWCLFVGNLFYFLESCDMTVFSFWNYFGGKKEVKVITGLVYPFRILKVWQWRSKKRLYYGNEIIWCGYRLFGLVWYIPSVFSCVSFGVWNLFKWSRCPNNQMVFWIRHATKFRRPWRSSKRCYVSGKIWLGYMIIRLVPKGLYATDNYEFEVPMVFQVLHTVCVPTFVCIHMVSLFYNSVDRLQHDSILQDMSYPEQFF